jgi:formate dehydrogenase subunit gamma
VIKKSLFFIIAFLVSLSAAYAADSQIWGKMLIPNILTYGKEGSSGLGPLFTLLQNAYFKKIFFGIAVGVPVVFLLHYLIFGARIFEHGGRKIHYFSLVKRMIHLMAAISFVILVPTGLMMVFGRYLGGGTLVMTARHLHAYTTPFFILAVIPMFFFWVLDMLPSVDDIKWMVIMGGYLSRKQQEIPAGKFNAGQKMWFWIATIGGVMMIATGAAMFVQDFNLGIAAVFGMTQIDLLRICAIIHNFLAMLIIAFFFTHVYMSLFVVKGSLSSMISGYKDEQEVKYLHSSFYKKLRARGEI